jgi:hypothetical protein
MGIIPRFSTRKTKHRITLSLLQTPFRSKLTPYRTISCGQSLKAQKGEIFSHRFTLGCLSLGKPLLNSSYWFGTAFGVQIWKRPVQSEKTSLIGWALYSTIGMSRDLLAKELAQLLQVELGIRWRIINTDKSGVMSTNDQVRAFHF